MAHQRVTRFDITFVDNIKKMHQNLLKIHSFQY